MGKSWSHNTHWTEDSPRSPGMYPHPYPLRLVVTILRHRRALPRCTVHDRDSGWLGVEFRGVLGEPTRLAMLRQRRQRQQGFRVRCCSEQRAATLHKSQVLAHQLALRTSHERSITLRCPLEPSHFGLTCRNASVLAELFACDGISNPVRFCEQSGDQLRADAQRVAT